MAESTRHGAASIYAAATTWVQRSLEHGSSLFTPHRRLWTATHFSELSQTDVSGWTTTGPVTGLPRASDDIRQLAAELLYVHLLVTSAITAARKQQLVDSVLATMTNPPVIEPELLEALAAGLVRPGVHFSGRRDVSVRFLIRFGAAWCELGLDEAQRALRDPWQFREQLRSVEVGSAFTQRNALLHLVHPNTFESVLSDHHKQLIAEHFERSVTVPSTDVDQQLLDIRRRLEAASGPGFDFYADAMTSRWAV
jgi:5-methylcytosine-specific restriction enzyme B